MAIIKKIFNSLEFNTGEFSEFAGYLSKAVFDNTNIVIVHINLRNYYYLCRDNKLKDLIKKNCFIVFDGIGMKIAFMLRGLGFLPDLNGTDLFPLVLNNMTKRNIKIYLLGSEKNVVGKAAENIKNNYPFINVCGYHNGFFSLNEEKEIIEEINNLKPNILLVGMGFPIQEKFVLRNLATLNVPFIWNVGGLFDTLSRYKPRAPQIIRSIKLEWLYRFVREPKRMLHRNTVAAAYSLCDIIFKNKN